MARHHTFRLILPADWREIPGQSPRQYKRRVEGAGVFQVSLQPPRPELHAKPDSLLPWLQAFIQDKMPELEAPVHEMSLECAAGPCAFSLRRSQQYGLIGLWVIAADAFVFATYTMGSPNTAKDEIKDAMLMMESAYFEESEGGLAGDS